MKADRAIYDAVEQYKSTGKWGWRSLCAEHLGVSLARVQSASKLLGRVAKRPESDYKRWSESDIETLDKFAKTSLSWSEIGRLMGRTGPACRRIYLRIGGQK